MKGHNLTIEQLRAGIELCRPLDNFQCLIPISRWAKIVFWFLTYRRRHRNRKAIKWLDSIG